MRYLLSSKLKPSSLKIGSSPSQHDHAHPGGIDRPVLELSLPDDTNLIMTDLSRRFSLLRTSGGLLPIGTVQHHLKSQRENGHLTNSEEDLILRELKRHQIEDPEPTKASSTSDTLLSASSTFKDVAYLQLPTGMPSSSELGLNKPIGPFRDPINQDSFLDLDLGVQEADHTEMIAKVEEEPMDPEDQFILTPTRYQRISRALDRIVDTHLATSTNGDIPAQTQAQTRSSLNPSHSSSASAESRVHQELLKALSVVSSTPPPSSSTLDSFSRLSPDDHEVMRSNKNLSLTIETSPLHDDPPSRSSSPCSLLSSTFHDSDHDLISELDLNSTQLFAEENKQEPVHTSPPDLLLPTCPIFSQDQLLPSTDIRYVDLFTIQQTLSSSAPPFQADKPSWMTARPASKLSSRPFLHRHGSNSTTSRTSPHPIVRPPPRSYSIQSNQAKLLQSGSGNRSSIHQRMRSKSISTERSRPGSSSVASSSVVDLNYTNNSMQLVPGLTTSLNTISPESQSFPVTPLPGQPGLGPRFSPLASASDVVQERLSAERATSPLHEVKEEDFPNPPTFDSKPPRPTKPFNPISPQQQQQQEQPRTFKFPPPLPLTQSEPMVPVIRTRDVSGRQGRPVPTTMLFKDVEALAVAANAALRQVAKTGAGEEVDEKKNKKKKSIIRGQIGAPKLVSASSNLAGVRLDQPVLHEEPEHLQEVKKKSGTIRNGFKIRLRKKKTQEVPGSPSPAVGETNVFLPAIDESRLMMHNLTTEGEGEGERKEMNSGTNLWRRETDPGLPNSTSFIRHRSRSSGSNHRLTGSKESNEVVRSEKITEQYDSSPTFPHSAGAEGHSFKRSLRKLLNPRGSHSKLSALVEGSPKQVDQEDISEEKRSGEAGGSTRSGSAGWVNVEMDTVAPLKIMKLGGTIRSRSRSRGLDEELIDVCSGAEDQHGEENFRLEPPLQPVEERPSTDSVQRLLKDLGLPPEGERSSKGSQPLISRWSSDARGGVNEGEEEEEGDLRTHWSTDGQSFAESAGRSKKGKGKATKEGMDWCGSVSGRGSEIVPPEVVVVEAVEKNGDDELHQLQRRRPSQASSSSQPRDEDVDAGSGDGDRSDYAASILDLYDRPDSSSLWDDGASVNVQDEETDQAKIDENRPRKRSFLDTPPSLLASTTDRRKSKKNDDDVMVMMNRFRQDLSSSRVSTASALLDSSYSRGIIASGVGGGGVGGNGGRRKTVVDDEEDEDRVWKIILGG